MNTAITENTNGALTLLKQCVQAEPGDRVLLIIEPENFHHYDPDIIELTLQTAQSIGIRTDTLEMSPLGEVADDFDKVKTGSPNDDWAEAQQRLSRIADDYDHLIFFSRVGDQLRFSELDCSSATMCYTLDAAALNSTFGTADYQGICRIKQAVDAALADATDVRISCPMGTDLRTNLQASGIRSPIELAQDVCVKRFPMLVPAPTPATHFEGKVVLSQFVTGTGSRSYDPYKLDLDNPVVVDVKGNEIVKFHGDDDTVAALSAHYGTISSRYQIEPWFVHSWHAGIHPGTSWKGSARADIKRWSGSAFGSPRLLHFHTCGHYAPGEICWYVFDPTISIDGKLLWENGVIHPELLPQGEQIISQHPGLETLFNNPQSWIGIET